MPKVSVIIPIYSVESFIEKCARSLFEQTLDDIEYLFIDDCTPDKSIVILKNVLDEYPNRKSQVIIHRMDRNSGQAKVREWGMKNASGDFVIHCDSDDWVDRTMYEKLYRLAVSSNSDISICDYQLHNGVDQIAIKQGLFKYDSIENVINDSVHDKIAWAVWNKMIRRDFYFAHIIYPENNMGEDMAIILQIYSHNPRICYVKEPLYYYFVNPHSIMNNVTKESTLRNFLQLKNNVECLALGLKKNNKYEDYLNIINYLYYRTSNILMPFIKDRDVKNFWKQHFKGRTLEVMMNPEISMIRKIRYVFIYVMSSISVR